ncbi:MAG: Crp/Fnr family transcriptional regulator [Sphingobacteriia bacterium]|nr:Crp/Fnr family transcriptional regulator [Sphingobacteriia bacterium]
MSTLENRILQITPLPEDVKKTFLGKWEKWAMPKDQFLVKENETANYIYYIEKGIARIFYYKNGKEITEWIAMDNSFFLSIISFFERTPSRLQIHTIEPSVVYGIHYDNLMNLCNEEHCIERWLRKALTGSLILSQYRMDSIQFESAQQRYEKLLENNPSIIQRVPLSYIASFLGITQETLSRIRSNL